MSQSTVSISGSTSLDMTGISALVVLIAPAAVSPLNLTLNNLHLGINIQLIIQNQGVSTIAFSMKSCTDDVGNTVGALLCSGGTLTNLNKQVVSIPAGNSYAMVGGLISPDINSNVPAMFLALI